MTRAPLILAAALLSSFAGAQAQAKYKLLDAQDRDAGRATYAHKLLTNGNKQVTMTLALINGYTIRKESVYDPTGKPVRMLEETSRGENRIQVLVEFDGKKAKARRLDKKDSPAQISELEGDLPYADKTALWFLKEKPKVGASEVVYSYAPSQALWRLIQTEYKGPKEVELQGKKWKGHLLIIRTQGSDSHMIVDDQGVPILIDSTLRFERIPEPEG